jgi:hypothetical protein
MQRPSVLVKKTLIFVHRWLGVASCLLFLLWFPSGIVMMYWDYPSVGVEDRLEHSPALDPGMILLSAAEAYAKLETQQPPLQVRLNTFDGRAVYRFRAGRGERLIYADTGEEQMLVPPDMIQRVASAWTGQPARSAQVESIEEVDQWTLQGGLRDLRPLLKYSWPNGEQVYVSSVTGEVVQYTTSSSRLWAYLGAIPHWLYFTPLRKHGPQWSQVVIWCSGIGTVAALLGITIGVWMFSPSKCYRNGGTPTSIPYRGQKRWHTILGLIFGVAAATWAFSGMLSMDPFPTNTGDAAGGTVRDKGKARGGASIPGALRGRFQLSAFEAKHPREALTQLSGLGVKELELTSFAGEPVYLAVLPKGEIRVVPLRGDPMPGFGTDRIKAVVQRVAEAVNVADVGILDDYDVYYLDRRHERPLPVVLVRLNDADHTRYYIDPMTARVVGSYSSQSRMTRWLYHGLHSLNFPWLYKYRPLWDIVVISFMVGGTALCITSLILAWRVVCRKLDGFLASRSSGSAIVTTEDLAIESD